MTVHKKITDYAGSRPEKFYKDTLFQGDHLMLGINCFEPGQDQHVHDHPDQDKFYYVVAGSGLFTVGAQQIQGTTGELIFAAAGVPHGVTNNSEEQLIIFMGMAPPPKPKT